jgi:hypothetical protein
VRLIVGTIKERQAKPEPKRPRFTFTRALPDGMTPEQARRRCLDAFAALAERGGR